MSRLVVDASVAVKWFANEEMAPQADALRAPMHELLALDHTLVEVASGLFRKSRRQSFASADIPISLDALRATLDIRAAAPFVDAGVAIAVSYGSSVYDSLYVALAIREGCQLVTADRKLYELLNNIFPRTLIWLGDVTADVL